MSYVKMCRMIMALAVVFGASGLTQGSGQVFIPPEPVYAQECGSCHVPYPARLLSAESWRAVLNGLDRHFGSDASLDPAALKPIADDLEAQARRRATLGEDGQPLLRITETRWFRHEHDEIPQQTWKLPTVQSPAHCEACHTAAERGNYSEHALPLPTE
jgi:hypothetical protein